MTTPIGGKGSLPLNEFAQSLQKVAAPTVSGTGETGFAEKLRELVADANRQQTDAQTAANDFSAGKNDDLHGTMIDMAKADISLRLVANVRNRMIEAYREVMRMGS